MRPLDGVLVRRSLDLFMMLMIPPDVQMVSVLDSVGPGVE